MKVVYFVGLAAITLLVQAIFSEHTLLPSLVAGVAGATASIVTAPQPASRGRVCSLIALGVGLLVGFATGQSTPDQSFKAAGLLSFLPPDTWSYFHVLLSAFLMAFVLSGSIVDGRWVQLYHDEFRICISWFVVLGIALLLAGRMQLITASAISCICAGLLGALTAQALNFLPIRRWRNTRTIAAYAVSVALSVGIMALPFEPALPATILVVACLVVSFAVLLKLVGFVNDRMTQPGPNGIRHLN